MTIEAERLPPALTTISSAHLQADIDPLGAQLYALRDAAGHDLQWNGDPKIWSGRAPILFPIVGELAGHRYLLDGKYYPLPRHGFARSKPFALIDATPSSALFRLRWDDETYAAYPFHFDLDIRFTIEDDRLTIAASAENRECAATMPASFGFHPALRWPLPYGQPRADHAITFEADEPEPIRRLDADGLVRPETFPTPLIGRKLVLRDDLFADDALIFDPIHSRRVRYGASDGPHLDIAFPDTSTLGLWTKPGAGYICIEPWHGHADRQGFAGDIRTKPGITLIAPGETVHWTMAITLRS